MQSASRNVAVTRRGSMSHPPRVGPSEPFEIGRALASGRCDVRVALEDLVALRRPDDAAAVAERDALAAHRSAAGEAGRYDLVSETDFRLPLPKTIGASKFGDDADCDRRASEPSLFGTYAWPWH
jgi:hypothetical protein